MSFARVEVRAVRAEQMSAALALAFRDALRPDERIAQIRSLIETGVLDTDGIRVAATQDGLVGVFLCQMLPGANGQVLAPAWLTDCSQTQDALIRDGIHWLRTRNARFIHLLTREKNVPGLDALTRAGFQHVTQIQLLRHALLSLPKVSELPTGLNFLAYSQTTTDRFAQALQESFEGTLDIPELNGVRTPQEVLAGMQGEGVFRPACWKLVCVGERTAGLLLLIEKPDIDGWELAYVGMTPRFRRRGIGSWLVQSALHEVSRFRARQLYVSVDARNRPALQLYARAGFSTVDEHDLFLYFFK